MHAQARAELEEAGLSPERVALMLELYERARQEEGGGAHQGGQEEQAAPLAEPDQDASAAAAEVCVSATLHAMRCLLQAQAWKSGVPRGARPCM